MLLRQRVLSLALTAVGQDCRGVDSRCGQGRFQRRRLGQQYVCQGHVCDPEQAGQVPGAQGTEGGGA